MSNIWKRSLSLLLAMVMVMGMVPMGALATETEDFDYENPDAEIVEVFEEEEAPVDPEEYAAEDVQEDVPEAIAEDPQEVAPASEFEEEVLFESVTTETETISEPIALAVVDKVPDNAKYVGLVWLDGGNQDALLSNVMQGGLRDLVLNAVGLGDKIDDADVKVLYGDENIAPVDVSNPTALLMAGLAMPMYDAIRDEKVLVVQIQDGDKAPEDAYIICRNLRDQNAVIRVTGVAAISNAGKPADLAAQIQAAVNTAVVTVKYGSEDWSDKTEIHRPEVTSFTWPEPGQEGKVDFTVFVEDALEVYTKKVTGTVKLVDTTPTYTLVYDPDNGEEPAVYQYIVDLAKAPKPANPIRQYYTFSNWEKINESEKDNVTTVAYKAIWTPNMDTDKNNVADQEQEYTLTFDYNYPEGVAGEPAAEKVTVKWGDKISEKTAGKTPVAPEGYEFVKWLSGSNTVTGNVTVKAIWVESAAGEEPGEQPGTPPADEYTVVYHLIEGNTFELTTKNQMVSNVSGATEGYVWDGWHKVTKKDDANIPVEWEKDAYFADEKDQLIKDEDKNKDQPLELIGIWLVDADGNNDPDKYTDHVYMFQPSGTVDNRIMYTKTVYPEEYATYKPLEMSYAKDNESDDVIFQKWEKGETSGDGYIEKVVYYPVFEAERNHNGKADSQEPVAVKIYKAEGLDYGTITIDGLDQLPAEEGIALAGAEFADYSETLNFTRDSVNGSEIKVQPKTGVTVDKISLTADGESLEMAYSQGYVTANLPKDAEEVHVFFRDASKFEVKANPELDVVEMLKLDQAGQKQAVYEAVVAQPAYDSLYADGIQVTYLARPAVTNGEASVQKLYKTVQDYESMMPGIWDRLVSFLNLKKNAQGEWVYTYNMEAVWKPLNYVPTAAERQDPQTIINNKIDELSNITIANMTNINELVADLGVELVKLDTTVKNSNYHAFMGSADSKETVDIVYNRTYPSMTLPEGPVQVNLVDKRTNVTLKVAPMTFTYGKVNVLGKLKELNPALPSEVLNNIVLSVDNIASKNAGVNPYTLVAEYPGNEAYKPAKSEEFQVTINKATLHFKMDQINASMEAKDYNFNAVKASAIDPATKQPVDVDIIQVIAGWDAIAGGVNLSKPVVSGLKGVAWIVVEDSVREMLEILLKETYNQAIPEKVTLAQATQKITQHKKALAAKFGETPVNLLEKALKAAGEYVSGEMYIEFGVPETLNTGAYLNVAIAVDPNYTVIDPDKKDDQGNPNEYIMGAIMIAPVVALPNRGGVQITYNGAPENVIALKTAKELENLKVQVNGKPVDATIHYYGITGQASAYNSNANDSKAPDKAGVYVASVIYYADNGVKVGSDAVIIIIGMEEATIDVARKVVAYDEENVVKYAPTYTVTKRDGSEAYPDIVMISGAAGVDYDEDLSLDDLYAEVNIDVPQWMGNLWDKFIQSNEAQKLGADQRHALPAKISKQSLVEFLNWCIRGVDEPVKYLESLGINHEIVNKVTDKLNTVTDYATKGLKKVLEKVEELPGTATNPTINIRTYTKTSGKAQVTGYDQKGVYPYIGIIVDSDYIPAVNGGVLVITGDPSDLILWNTYTPWDGEGKEPLTHNNTGREGLTFFYDYANKKAITLLVDDDADNFVTALENKLNTKYGTTLRFENNTVTIAGLKTKLDNWAEKTAFAIVDVLADYAKTKLPDRFGDNVDGGAAKLKDLAEKLQPHVADCLKEMDKFGDVSITIKKDDKANLPKNVGKYQFLVLSYGMVYDSATLYIEPTYFSAYPKDATKVYGATEPAPNYAGVEVDFYSRKSVLVKADENDSTSWYTRVDTVDCKDVFSADDIGLKWEKIVRDEGEDVGAYEMRLEDVTFNDIFQGTLVQDKNSTGTFTITKKPITIAVEDQSPYYDYEDTGVTEKTYTSADGLVGEDVLTVTFTYDPEKVGMAQDLTAEYTMTSGNLDNYDITVVNAEGKTPTVTVQPAQIVLDLDDITTLTVNDTADKIPSAVTYQLNADSMGSIDLEKIANTLAEHIGANIHVEGDYEDANGRLLPDTFPISCAPYVGDKFAITFNDAKLIVDLAGYICWNMEKGIYWKDLSDALDKADAGETVQMLADSTQEDMLMVKAGTTLDLNGSYVTAGNLLSFGQVEDTAETTGGVKISIDRTVAFTQLQKDNVQLPIYDTANGCYRFYSYSLESRAARGAVDQNGSQSVTFGFTLNFDKLEAYKLMANTADTGLKIGVNIDWSIRKLPVIPYTYTQDLIVKFGNQAYANYTNSDGPNGKTAFTFTLYGLEALGTEITYTVVPTLSNEAGMKTEASQLSYEY